MVSSQPEDERTVFVMGMKRYKVIIIKDNKPFEMTIEAEIAEGALRKVLPQFFKGQDYKTSRATVEMLQLPEPAADG